MVSAIDHQTLPPLDRLGLLDDLFALVQAGHSSTVEVLTLLEAFANEDQYTVWNRVCSALSKLSQLLAYTEHHELLKSTLPTSLSVMANRYLFSSLILRFWSKITWKYDPEARLGIQAGRRALDETPPQPFIRKNGHVR